MSNVYEIYGGPGSPYSHKIRAVFRYRRIPHTWQVPVGGFSGDGSLGSDSDNPDSPLTAAAKGVVPVVKYPEDIYRADSTPMIDDLETRHSGRSVIPTDAGIEFLARLIEDLADEYLPIPMFYSRWTIDRQWCGRRQMIGWSEPIDDDELTRRATNFLERQGGQLRSNFDPVQMQTATSQFYAAMENLLSQQHFLFGSRPSLADFALYGQLTQYAVDPAACNLMKDTAVRTYQWTHLVDDLSGWEGHWLGKEKLAIQCLTPFLAMVKDYYLPMGELMLGLSAGQDLSTALNGLNYRAKTLLDLKSRLSKLPVEALDWLEPLLKDNGCWDGLQFREGEAERVVPILPQ